MDEKRELNKMGTEPVDKLLLSMGLPMIVSMILQALYNIVDSYFVSCMKDTAEISDMGEYGVNALTLAFPVQMLMVAVGVGTGVGVNALLAKSLGSGDRKKASLIAGNSVFLGICTYVVFLLFGIFGVDAYVSSQTNDPLVKTMCGEYLRICCVFSFGITMYTIYEKLLQATGRTVLCTAAQIIGAVVNIVLDPLLIFGMAGLPEMGIKGAAYATVIGQSVSFILDAVFHYLFNKDLDHSAGYILPSGAVIGEIYREGIPAILMQALMSFMTYGVNIIFGRVSDSAVTAYGVYYKIQQFVFFAAFGLNNAIIPIVSFNFGMRSKRRIKDGIKYGMIYTLVIMAIGMLGLEIFAEKLASVFSLTDSTRELCVLSIRIIAAGYLFAGANIAFQGIFQAFGCGVDSLIISMLRLIIIALPAAYIFTLSENAGHLIWLAFPIAEALASAVGIYFMVRISRKHIAVLEDNETAAVPTYNS